MEAITYTCINAFYRYSMVCILQAARGKKKILLIEIPLPIFIPSAANANGIPCTDKWLPLARTTPDYEFGILNSTNDGKDEREENNVEK